MMRTINVILVGLMLGGAGVVYLMKYDSERAAGRIAKLQHAIVERRQEIASLKAEWSLLNQPRRIQELVEKYRSYLELDALDPNQVASIEEIPLRPSAASTSTPDATKPAASRMLAIGKPGDLTASLPKKPTATDAGAHKATERLNPLASPKTIDPKPNDPINALIR
jgi:hypothetical protein